MKKIISILLIVSGAFLLSCKDKDLVDYYVKAIWIYANDTEHTIEVKIGYAEYKDFIIEPAKSHTFDIHRPGDGKTTIQKDNFEVPITRNHTKIVYNGEEYPISGGATDMGNYLVERLNFNQLQFTYTFTEENLPKDE